MKKLVLFRNKFAVSEIIGGLILVLIALLAFVPIYLYMFPIPLDSPDASITKLEAYVNTDGLIVLEHMGGKPLSEYRIDVRYVNGTLIKSTDYKASWSIGYFKYPLETVGTYLLSGEDEVFIGVYAPKEDQSEKTLFEGVLTGIGSTIYCNLEVIIIGEGSVSPGSGIYTVNTIVTLTAMPSDGYRVKSWDETDNDPFTGSNYNTVTMNGDKTVTVEFEVIPPGCYILDACVIRGNGSVFPESGIFDNGTVVPLTASPNPGYRVKEWNETDNDPFTGVDSNTVTMNSDKNVTVEFEYYSDLLISSLRTNTTDEDLICYNFSINPSIEAQTYIYNWLVNGNPLAEVVMPFDTEHTTTTKDYSGNGYNGTVNGATWTNNGIVGGAYYYSGSSKYISASLPTVFSDIANNDFTVSLWVKSSSINDDWRVVLHASVDNKNFVKIFQYGTELHFGVCDDGTKGAMRTENLSSDTWYHIAGVWDASENTISLYINGEPCIEIGNRQYSLGSDYGLEIGHGSASSRFWLGFIDELEIYDYGLSEEQIYQIYLSTKDGNSDKRVIVSQETSLGETWQCAITPNDGIQDDIPTESNTLQIISYAGGE